LISTEIKRINKYEDERYEVKDISTGLTIDTSNNSYNPEHEIKVNAMLRENPELICIYTKPEILDKIEKGVFVPNIKNMDVEIRNLEKIQNEIVDKLQIKIKAIAGHRINQMGVPYSHQLLGDLAGEIYTKLCDRCGQPKRLDPNPKVRATKGKPEEMLLQLLTEAGKMEHEEQAKAKNCRRAVFNDTSNYAENRI
jgi:hypothetical protein